MVVVQQWWQCNDSKSVGNGNGGREVMVAVVEVGNGGNSSNSCNNSIGDSLMLQRHWKLYDVAI